MVQVLEKHFTLHNRYYKERSTIALQAAKKQERIVDDEIKRVDQIQEQKIKQPDLFSWG